MVLVSGIAWAGTGSAVPGNERDLPTATVEVPEVAPVPAPDLGELLANTFTSGWFLEVTRLLDARIGQEVLLAFIANTPGTFNLRAEHIIYLNNLGASSAVINAMLEHDLLINSGALQVTASTAPLPWGGQRLSVVAPAPATQPPSSLSPSDLSAVLKKLSSALNKAGTPSQGQPSPAVASPMPTESIVVKNDAPEPDWVALLEAADDVPEQPDSLYRVRLPYPVKLTDPIIVFHYPGY